MTHQTALDCYRALIAQAGHLQAMAKDDASGGVSFWNAAYECSGGAIASSMYVPPANMTHRLSPEQIHAINWVTRTQSMLDAIWNAAAAHMLANAAELRVKLVEEARELGKIIESLDTEPKP